MNKNKICSFKATGCNCKSLSGPEATFVENAAAILASTFVNASSKGQNKKFKKHVINNVPFVKNKIESIELGVQLQNTF